jgi:hypothetical protein
MGFKSKNTNWTEVSAAGTSSMIPAGGYVAKILSVEDVESKEYLRFTYDIAEGEHKGFFETDDRPYTHQFIRSYKDTAAGFMKQFLDCVDDSNDRFNLSTWDNDPNGLMNMLIGVLIQREDYTNQNGEDRARMNVVEFTSAENIRNNRYVLPEPEDNRADKGDEQSSKPTSPEEARDAVYGADVPF